MGGFCDAGVEVVIAGVLRHQDVKGRLKTGALRRGGGGAIGQQLAIEGPVVAAEVRQEHLVRRDHGAQLGVVPAIMDPTQGVGVRDPMVDVRIIAQQPTHDGHAGLGVVGGNRQRIPHLLPLLRVQPDAGGIQVGAQFRRRQGALPRQPLHQAHLEGRAQRGFGHPGEGICVQQKDRLLALEHR